MTCCGNPDASCCKHPNGGYIWVPLISIAISLILTAVNNSCNLATLGQVVSIKGLTCTDPNNNTLPSCGYTQYEADAIGLFTFRDSNTNQCILYDYDEIDSWRLSSIIFSGLRWLFAIIVFFWLLFSTCCPIRAVHKQTLTFLTLCAAVFQGLFFLFYGSDICKANGCNLSTGGIIAIVGAGMFFVTALAMRPIKPLKPSYENDEESKVTQQTVTKVQTENEPPVTGIVLGDAGDNRENV